MSSQNRLVWFLLPLLPLLLCGCGFHPLYAKHPADDTTSKLTAGVKIEPIEGRSGQILRSNLEDRLNPAGYASGNPAYRLNIKLTHNSTPIAVARDGTVARYNVQLTSQYVLTRNADDKIVARDQIGYVNSYNNLTPAYYSTYIAEQDAIKRGLIELSELYRQRLAIYLDAGAPDQKLKDDPAIKKKPVPLSPDEATTIRLN